MTEAAAPSPSCQSKRRWDSALLSFVAAFVDTACFIGLFGLFTAHVTGNFVWMGAELVNGEGAILAQLLALPVFVLAVVGTALADRVLRRRGLDAAPPLLATQSLLLGAAVAAVLLLPRPMTGHDAGALVIGLLAVAAMGVQNALMRLELTSLPPSTVMTGNVTQFVIDAVAFRGAPTLNEAQALQLRMRNLAPGVIAFLLGAAAAAMAFVGAGLLSLALPAALCGVLAWRLRRH